jgi:hypothetical protein
MPRKATPPEIKKEVLLLCRRRCCLCYGLNNDLTEKQGQIAHLDRIASHNEIENLAFLCLPHHDQYDTRTSQSKGLTGREVKHFRRELHDLIVRDPDSLNANRRSVEFQAEDTFSRGGIDGEIYRLDIVPRCLSWEIVKDAYRVSGNPEDAKLDCDVVIEMYLVNQSTRVSRYPSDLQLSAEIRGTRVNFERQNELRAIDINHKKYEYGLAHERFGEKEQIKQLFSSLPFCLSPTQRVKGFERFMAKEINPDNIQDKSWKLNVVDSLGDQHPITKTDFGKGQKGKIALCQLRP